VPLLLGQVGIPVDDVAAATEVVVMVVCWAVTLEVNVDVDFAVDEDVDTTDEEVEMLLAGVKEKRESPLGPPHTSIVFPLHGILQRPSNTAAPPFRIEFPQ
jgi:hypothetical protein